MMKVKIKAFDLVRNNTCTQLIVIVIKALLRVSHDWRSDLLSPAAVPRAIWLTTFCPVL
jgi:hypothetical protein